MVGVTAQLGIMPVMGFIVAELCNFSPEIALRIVLIGCSPSGGPSNEMAYVAKINLVLFNIITSIAIFLVSLYQPILD